VIVHTRVSERDVSVRHVRTYPHVPIAVRYPVAAESIRTLGDPANRRALRPIGAVAIGRRHRIPWVLALAAIAAQGY